MWANRFELGTRSSMFMTSMAMIEGLQLRLCVGVANVVVANLLSWALECTIVNLLVLHKKNKYTTGCTR